MSLCNPATPIQTIDLDECIGLSLATINTNFRLLQEQNCLTYSDLITIQNDLTALNSRYNSLTALRPQIAKAVAAFNGTGTPLLSYNIARITRPSTGTYSLSFTTTFPNISYALIGTSISTTTSANNYTWVQPSTTGFTTTSATINIRDLSGTFVNPDYVSIAVYSL
jgi:hypothetical protein